MEITVAGSASSSIPNDFVIATNLTIQFDGLGTYAGDFSGNFSGNPGAKLTFMAPDSNSPTNEQVRFYGTNTTYNGNLVLSNSFIILAPYQGPGFTQTYNGVISGLGAITQRGSGLTILNGPNTYTGPTTVSDGTLQVNGSLNAASAVTVNSNATLAGTGTINGPVTVNAGGTLAPSTSAAIGTITLNGGLTLKGNLFFKVNTSVSPSNDFASVTGTLTNGGTGTLTVTNLGPALVAGDTFKLFNKALTNAVSLTANLPALSASLAWSNNLAADGSIRSFRLPAGDYKHSCQQRHEPGIQRHQWHRHCRWHLLRSIFDQRGLAAIGLDTHIYQHLRHGRRVLRYEPHFAGCARHVLYFETALISRFEDKAAGGLAAHLQQRCRGQWRMAVY